MSEQQRSRRRFLADLLFLGGAAGAAAFLVQSRPEAPTPEVTATPSVCEKPIIPEEIPQPAGAAPVPPPTEPGNMAQPTPEPPKMLGDVEPVPAPEPQVRGRVKIAHPPPDSSGGPSQ